MYSSILILPDQSVPLSFTDDSSPRLGHRPFKVSMHAQIWKNSDLDWYFEILFFSDGTIGEIKSSDAMKIFGNLPTSSQRKIWKGLSRVPIHIVDPFQYQLQQRKIIREINSAAEEAYNIIRIQAREGNSQSKKTLKLLDTQLLERIIWDSPGEQLRRRTIRLINPVIESVPDELAPYFPSKA